MSSSPGDYLSRARAAVERRLAAGGYDDESSNLHIPPLSQKDVSIYDPVGLATKPDNTYPGLKVRQVACRAACLLMAERKIRGKPDLKISERDWNLYGGPAHSLTYQSILKATAQDDIKRNLKLGKPILLKGVVSAAAGGTLPHYILIVGHEIVLDRTSKRKFVLRINDPEPRKNQDAPGQSYNLVLDSSGLADISNIDSPGYRQFANMAPFPYRQSRPSEFKEFATTWVSS